MSDNTPDNDESLNEIMEYITPPKLHERLALAWHDITRVHWSFSHEFKPVTFNICFNIYTRKSDVLVRNESNGEAIRTLTNATLKDVAMFMDEYA